MRLIISLLILLNLPLTATAQYLPADYNADPLLPHDTNSLFLSVDNANFFKNNEYFNDYVAGYSKIGFFLRPRLSYTLSAKTRISGGMHLLKYSGEQGFHKVRPVFRVEQRLSKDIKLLMGSIRSTYQHGLIDPLYHFERYLDENIENGVQFLVSKPFIKADVWVNWKNFILRGSESQEEFETGIASEVPVYDKKGNFSAMFPIQLLFQHKGGQIDNTDKPVSTLSNFAAGPVMHLDFPSSWLTSVDWENLYVGYRNLSTNKKQDIQAGHAFLSTLSVKRKQLQLQLSWWKAEDFLSFAGNPIYQVYSLKKERIINENRELFMGKLRYSKQYQDLRLIFNLDTYWKPGARQLDYGFGIYLLLNTDMFLTEVKRK